MSMNISGASYFGFLPKIDAEWQRIINRLWNVYGIRSTGSKALDKQILHEHELTEAKKENSVSSKFLTVTKSELEKIISKKKNNKAENQPVNEKEVTKGAEILGQQIFLAIKMKRKNNKTTS